MRKHCSLKTVIQSKERECMCACVHVCICVCVHMCVCEGGKEERDGVGECY